MDPRHSALLLCLSLLLPAQARATNFLPEGCGFDKVKLNVAPRKDPPPPAPPAAEKAQLVFIEVVEKPPACSGCGDFTTRFGMDGAWVGAGKENSYFTLTVDPGEHQLCAAGYSRDDVATASFTAEAGKTYYFLAKRTLKIRHGAGPGHPLMGLDRSFDLIRLAEDEGKEDVKASEPVTWEIK